MSGGPYIRGEHTRLRPIARADIGLLRDWRNRLREHFLDTREITPEAQARWFDRYLGNDNDLLFAIETHDGIPIGFVGLNDIDPAAGEAEFGRLMIGDERYAGLGLGKDAARALIDHAAKDLGLHRLVLHVKEDNARAISVYRSIGFEFDPASAAETSGRNADRVLSMSIVCLSATTDDSSGEVRDE